MTALRIGVLSLNAARGTVDGAAVRSEGERLLVTLGERLSSLRQVLDEALGGTLRAYFDPSSGSFTERVQRLLPKDGELAALIGGRVDAARRSLDTLFHQHVGEDSELRRLHVALDNAVRDAYVWTDLNLGHDFVEVETLPENDRVRYTISPAARKEVLKRLLALNHQRAKEEAAQAPAAKPKGAGRKKAAASAAGPGLFEDL